jgi:hypothetical protein
MSGPIEEALKSLNESIALLDKNKHLIDEETYLIMKENLLSIDKNINRATKGVNDDNDDDEYYDDASDINFFGPFTLVVTHNTSFDIVFNIVEAMWRDKDKSEKIQQSFRNPSTGWWEALEKSRAYNAEQARLHNIEPTNKDVLSFNYYLRQAMHHWGNFNTEWYRNGAAFNLECDSNEYGIIL